jgi:hypothetical protein
MPHVPFDVNAKESRDSRAKAVSTFPVTIVRSFRRCSQDIMSAQRYLSFNPECNEAFVPP